MREGGGESGKVGGVHEGRWEGSMRGGGRGA